jgi:hypothetical protein
MAGPSSFLTVYPMRLPWDSDNQASYDRARHSLNKRYPSSLAVRLHDSPFLAGLHSRRIVLVLVLPLRRAIRSLAFLRRVLSSQLRVIRSACR